MDRNIVEALCAAAYDCKPEGRRLVGLPPPLVRALEAVARAAEEYTRTENGYVPVDVLAWGAEMKRTRDALKDALAKLAEVRHA